MVMTSRTVYIVERPSNRGGDSFYVHAFSLRENAERFAKAQDIPNYRIIETTAGELGREIAFAPQDSGSVYVMPKYGNQDAFRGLFDPFIDRTAKGQALWHVELREDASTAGIYRAYSQGRCHVHLIPEEGESTHEDWTIRTGNFVVHCFASSEDEARTIARALYAKQERLLKD